MAIDSVLPDTEPFRRHSERRRTGPRRPVVPPWPDWFEPSFAERVDLAARFRSGTPSGPFRRESDCRLVRDLRDPWMDPRLVEFLLGLDSESLYCGGTYKRSFRRASIDRSASNGPPPQTDIQITGTGRYRVPARRD